MEVLEYEAKPTDNIVDPFDSVEFPEFKAGSVWISGAGPGDVGLVSLLTCHALRNTDIVLYDALVNPDILKWAKPGALCEFVGKRKGNAPVSQDDICSKLVEYAKQEKRVLRLKGGDPFLFGRGAEECLFLAQNNVPFRVIPAVSSGVGGLAYAGIPITHRGINKSVLFLTGHDSTGRLPEDLNWKAINDSSPVLVFFMATGKIREIARLLFEHGRSIDEPVGIVYRASMPDQKVSSYCLGDLLEEDEDIQFKSPSLVVVGKVVNIRDTISWF